MSQRPAPSLLLVFMLMIPGVCSQWSGWGVSYSPSHICALQGSTVTMNCTYTYPTGYKIRKEFWTKGAVKEDGEYLDLSKDPEYSQRLQYLGDKQQNCTIRLSHVTLKDSRMYYFRFITNKPDGKWTGVPGVTLTVTGDFDLQVESPERVTEGDSVRLTCKSSCTLTDRATFIWYRDSQLVTGINGNQLDLGRINREDTSRYSCGVDGHSYRSPAVQLNIRYPPENPVISISPSGEIKEGDSVTLICCSDSNPPAVISWFKGGTFVGSGRIYNISKISSDDSGEYKCKSINEHGEKYSDAVTLNVMLHHGLGWHVWLGITLACLGFIIIIIIILFIMRKRKGAKVEDLTAKQDNLYSNATVRDVHVSESADCDDAQYATVTYSKPRRDRNAPDRRDNEEIQYATVHHKNKQTKRSEENESEYDNIRIRQPESAVRRSNVETVEDASVIYSRIK